MAIESGTAVRTASPDKWQTWGWINVDGEIKRVLLDPSRVYTVTIASSRFKRDDGTYQSVIKLRCTVTGVEVMAEKSSVIEDM